MRSVDWSPDIDLGWPVPTLTRRPVGESAGSPRPDARSRPTVPLHPLKLDIELQAYHPDEPPPPVGEERYELLPEEVNRIVARHNDLVDATASKWRLGYDGTYCWTTRTDGTVDRWRAATGSTAAQRSTTYPGAGTAWARVYDADDSDPVATYEAALA